MLMLVELVVHVKMMTNHLVVMEQLSKELFRSLQVLLIMYIVVASLRMVTLGKEDTMVVTGGDGCLNTFPGYAGAGASDIRSVIDDYTTRLVVGGGGGGQSLYCDGGNAGLNGYTGYQQTEDNNPSFVGVCTASGGGGAQNHGGTAGDAQSTHGVLGQGGAGFCDTFAGGGGGGGYYGGGGGGQGAPGGGGSSLVPAGCHIVEGYSGDGMVIIYYADAPTSQPSRQPSRQPTRQPARQPTSQPITKPSSQPSSHPSKQPSKLPTNQPTSCPSARPSIHPAPSSQPTLQPSRQPSSHPSAKPSRKPSNQPSSRPSTQPSSHPSRQPTHVPSVQPSSVPSHQPLSGPSKQPSKQPSCRPSCQPTIQPRCRPSGVPTSQPSGRPTTEPSSQPSIKPSTRPSIQPSTRPSVTPSTFPSVYPSAQPSSQPSCSPSCQPTLQPSLHPSSRPTLKPSVQPSSQPASKPTSQPSTQPSMFPVHHSTSQPSSQPSSLPNSHPTSGPSYQPSLQPNSQPSQQPASHPSSKPTFRPTISPSNKPSHQPTSKPSDRPTSQPFENPTNQPTEAPSATPSAQPSIRPVSEPMIPSSYPSSFPTLQPATTPSSTPTIYPSCQPSIQPSVSPSYEPTSKPSDRPSQQPSTVPTLTPSMQPFSHPSCSPSTQPSLFPSTTPSVIPSVQPSIQPTSQPSDNPNSLPSVAPSFQPSMVPSKQPSLQPTNQPSVQLVTCPSSSPSVIPSSKPSKKYSAPSSNPSGQPVSLSSRQPTSQPSLQPTTQPLSQPSIQPLSSPSRSPTFTPTTYEYLFSHPVGTLPSNKSISVFGNEVFKIILPFKSVSPADLNVFSDIHLNSHNIGTNYILFGSNQLQHIDLSKALLSYSHVVGLDSHGRSASTILDFNGDGYNDLVIGDPYAARCYVLFGSFNGLTNMTEGFTIFGEDQFDLTGWSVSGAGDVNNDTYNDIVIGAPNARGVGAVYVIYGHRSSWNVELKTLTASSGFAVYGTTLSDFLGVAVSNSGDVNKDGFDDVIFSAMLSSKLYTGRVYLFLGGANISTTLSTNQWDEKRLMEFHGEFAFSQTGFSIAGVGDANKDGYDDFLIGSNPTKPNLRSFSYLIYGHSNISNIQLSSLQQSQGIIISGGGIVVSGIGDINHDGFDDLVIGSNYATTHDGFVVYLSSSFNTFTPTRLPTKLPTIFPTVMPVEEFGPTVLPTFSLPTSVPTLSPSTETPSSLPSTSMPSEIPFLEITKYPSTSMIPTTLTPTNHEVVSEPTFRPTEMEKTIDYVIGDSESVSGNIVFNRTQENYYLIINSTANVLIELSGGRDIFKIVPRRGAMLSIYDFNTTGDMIDLTLFYPFIAKLSDIKSTSLGYLEIELPDNQIIKIYNLQNINELHSNNILLKMTINVSHKHSKLVIYVASTCVAIFLVLMFVFISWRAYEYFNRLKQFEAAEVVVDHIMMRRSLFLGQDIVKRNRQEKSIFLLEYSITVDKIRRRESQTFQTDAIDSVNEESNDEVLNNVLEQYCDNNVINNNNNNCYDSICNDYVEDNNLVDEVNSHSYIRQSSFTDEKGFDLLVPEADSCSDISYNPMNEIQNDFGSISITPVELLASKKSSNSSFKTDYSSIVMSSESVSIADIIEDDASLSEVSVLSFIGGDYV